jgi:hypothetical protein
MSFNLIRIEYIYHEKFKMKMTYKEKLYLLMLVLTMLFPTPGYSWTEHPLLVSKALKDLPLWKNMDSVQVKSLKTFLIENEKELVTFLANEEKWALANLPNYTKCPENLTFKASGNEEDILNRFFLAIRINPVAKIPLYLHLLPDESAGNRPLVQPAELTTLKDFSSMLKTNYIRIREGDKVFPFDVLCTANDEPDYGFDLGLFEDNNTSFGKKYGFGLQPFGNPNLEYSSQAPFHMGFYHEAGILYKFANFLKHTHLDYRIFLYKALSEFAFRQNQPYWGWRFMGWGMHYVGDVSMPYHMKPLPGVSTFHMIWINIKAMLGWPEARKNAIQIVSNKHTVLEEFQVQSMRKAYEEKNSSFPLFQALAEPTRTVSFSYSFLIGVASRESADNAKAVNKALKKDIPALLVSDPLVEANERPETKNILQYMTESKGGEAVSDLTRVVAIQMHQFSRNIRCFMDAILQDKDK